MREITTVISNNNYGAIKFKLREMLNKQTISRTRLAKVSGADYRVIKRIYDGDLVKLDLDVIARICYVLECDISDIIEYRCGCQSR